ncbi:phospholipase-B 81-like [Mercenaria mercenaria]|uniref:phospholipase-B 81-like n=1 Tax=Mercenaria mercenaria TaxID=6596 RepID=UPI00234F5A09|nr:phospholipase-B 81-like [Mercenaria mercenaria]
MAAPISQAATKKFNFLFRFFYFFLCFLSGAHGVFQTASVYCQDRQCTYKLDVLDIESATAYGVYNDTLAETGWGILNITAGRGSKKAENTDLMFAAGYLEGILTQKRIFQHFQNLNDYFKTKLGNNTEAEKAVKAFFLDQDIYMRKMIKNNVPDSPYWRHMAYILSQYDGLVKGYGDIAPDDMKLSLYAFQVLNGNGDMLDLINAVNPKSIPDFDRMTTEEAVSFIAKSGRCSALVKVLGAYEDVFMSHSSWFIYQATMRIYKHYDFNVDDPDTAAKQISFSSYPGFLESLDDFYLMSSGLVMLQTTNNVFNTSLYSQVTSQSLLAWHRVRLAHMLAHGGKEWAAIFAENNSGTYNNQYMILDLRKIELEKTIHDDALWIVEQIPGLVEYGDATPILRTGYWPSYNVPYFEKVYNMSGYPDFVKKHGTDFSYQLAPRAKIFRRDEGKVVDMPTMKNIMRYNDYKKDPYSEGDSCNAICCRGDLRKGSPGPFGCYDTKVSNYKMALEMTADIINGPTLGTGLPPFQWTPEYKQSHIGLPNEYKFDFIQTRPLKSPEKHS